MSEKPFENIKQRGKIAVVKCTGEGPVKPTIDHAFIAQLKAKIERDLAALVLIGRSLTEERKKLREPRPTGGEER